MPNTSNLKPMNTRTPEEIKAISSKGGKAAQQKLREKRELSKLVEIWANNKLKDKDLIAQLAEYGIKDPDNKSIILLSLIKNINISRNSNRTIEQLIDLLGENREREARIRKLELENEILQKQLDGAKIEKPVIFIDDTKEVENED